MFRNCTPGPMAQAALAGKSLRDWLVRDTFTFRAQPRPVPCWHGRSPWMVAKAAHLERQQNGRSFFAGSTVLSPANQ